MDWREQIDIGAEREASDDLFRDRPSTLIKLVRHPGREERGQGVGAHKGTGILTLLLIEPGRDGLQVEHDGGWIDPRWTRPSPPVDLPPALAAKAPGISQDPVNVISGTFGENMLKSRLRAHPDVAAAHHPDLVG